MENGAAQQLPGIGPQRLDEDHLGGLRRGGVAEASTAESSRVPHVHPIGGSIDRPLKALGVDKGFQQQHAMTEDRFPVARQTPLAQRQNARSQVGDMPAGQDALILLMLRLAQLWRFITRSILFVASCASFSRSSRMETFGFGKRADAA